MSYKLIVSRDAHEDLTDITGYIARELKNPQAAADFLGDVEESYKRG
jgi:plasmid stabilization system protein ParE